MPSNTGGSHRAIEKSLGRLYENQSRLPRLPVPSLESTLLKYSRSLEPLLSAEDLAESKRVIEAFAKSSQAKELQKRLEARAADPGCANWLEEWWNDLSYMGYRDPVIPYVSYHYSFNDDPECQRPNQRAAKLILGALSFRKMVVDGSLEPEKAKSDVLCSHSYNFMFNACRIPGKPSDHCRIGSYDHETIVVIRNNQLFSFEFAPQGTQLTMGEIERVLDRIVRIADSRAAVPVGILTADNRDSWTDNRELLIESSPENIQVLDEIESSAFVLSLEKDRPVTREEFSHAIWHGNGRNRWFDKPCQFVVTDSARAGFNGEHSMMDGTPTLRLVEYVNGFKPSPEQIGSSVEPRASSEEDGWFHELKFVTPPAVVSTVKKAEAVFSAGVAKQHLKVLNFAAFGKEEIKRLGCSPDAFIQMVIQLAYTRLHKIARPTYESSMTRKYLHGRTETCRSVTNESVAWCRAMATTSTSAEERVRLFKQALAKHTQLTREAVEGQGVDRHLLGLRMLIRPDESKPDIFNDPAYAYSSHWYLSTSQISSENFTSYGWSEVSPKGYGIAYNIRKESLLIHITCMRNEYGLNSDHLASHFEAAATDVRNMILSAAAQQK
ncbi:Carnitine O-acetyltransferase mitochondrial [Coemansia sp. RSA 1722]|nr:Carnitine O-acetyltransferase mitochondrial [Coemansia sp. RSA 1722]KAJ2603039.1 Carnitine O-acetyltransferase mitochondrial [Coemansia sp. RSA 1721]KAJ2640385.1 Carnitine O-acetyltransferase mitochondrial [Coemansia sp. RSA 1286]